MDGLMFGSLVAAAAAAVGAVVAVAFLPARVDGDAAFVETMTDDLADVGLVAID